MRMTHTTNGRIFLPQSFPVKLTHRCHHPIKFLGLIFLHRNSKMMAQQQLRLKLCWFFNFLVMGFSHLVLAVYISRFQVNPIDQDRSTLFYCSITLVLTLIHVFTTGYIIILSRKLHPNWTNSPPAILWSIGIACTEFLPSLNVFLILILVNIPFIGNHISLSGGGVFTFLFVVFSVTFTLYVTPFLMLVNSVLLLSAHSHTKDFAGMFMYGKSLFLGGTDLRQV
jgi:hypothetical protein